MIEIVNQRCLVQSTVPLTFIYTFTIIISQYYKREHMCKQGALSSSLREVSVVTVLFKMVSLRNKHQSCYSNCSYSWKFSHHLPSHILDFSYPWAALWWGSYACMVKWLLWSECFVPLKFICWSLRTNEMVSELGSLGSD